MSVAFRRESDDEHLEPTFELPLPSGPNLVTPRGRALIDDRIAALERQIAETGDAEEVKKLRRDLRYWQTRQVTAVETAPRSDGAVGFGNRVTFTLAGKERQVTLVGDDEGHRGVLEGEGAEGVDRLLAATGPHDPIMVRVPGPQVTLHGLDDFWLVVDGEDDRLGLGHRSTTRSSKQNFQVSPGSIDWITG